MAKFIIKNPWTKQQKVGDIYEADVLHPALRNHVTEVKEAPAPEAPAPEDPAPADDVPAFELAEETDGVEPAAPEPEQDKGKAPAKSKTGKK